ncbi:RidA family protein [Dyella jejuensis]|uniref:RidA family protein n=1 Tax=Dyella jejuensis TaxID=1432009 RepID=A0ABW8JP60_9GAMM
MRKYITEGIGLPQWSSPISHAVVVNDICYVSGQLAIDSAGNYVSGSVTDEALQAFSNLFSAISAAGFHKNDLAFIDVALIDIADIDQLNSVYRHLFVDGRRPARTVCQAAALPFGGKVKICGVAIRDRSPSGNDD